MRKRWMLRAGISSLAGVALAAALALASLAAPAESDLDLDSLPMHDWLSAGETTAIPWRIQTSDVELRMDQRFDVTYSATLRGGDLNRSGASHELFLISRMSSAEGEWVNDPVVVRKTPDREMPQNAEVRFEMRALLRPGDYHLWLVLYDRATGLHNVAVRRVRAEEIRNDPFPDALRDLPRAHIVEDLPAADPDDDEAPGALFLPVLNRTPIEVDIVAILSPPEQWSNNSGRAATAAAMLRAHSENTLEAMVPLVQLQLTEGSVAVAGLNVVERTVAFQQTAWNWEQWTMLRDAFEEATEPVVSVAAIEGRTGNAAFIREFLEQRIAERRIESSPDAPEALKVVIVLSSSLLFERGSEIRGVSVGENCNCLAYHLRLQAPPRLDGSGRLIREDIFDELGRIVQPLRPATFRITSPLELRRAIGAIRQDLEALDALDALPR